MIAFSCSGETLLGTLDEAPGTIGLLIVSGGNEIRAGAHRGMATLASRLAAQGVPVFRYDRRGVGDSSGENTGYSGARDDLLAATAAFRAAAPQVARIVGFGNCDAATTLALWGHDAGVESLILANPWVVAPGADLPPPAAIRAHYGQRLRDPETWWRLLRGGISLRKATRGLRAIAAPPSADTLTQQATGAITRWGDDATVILARGDNTAIAYAEAVRGRAEPHTIMIDTASHSFARPGDAAALEAAILQALRR